MTDPEPVGTLICVAALIALAVLLWALTAGP